MKISDDFEDIFGQHKALVICALVLFFAMVVNAVLALLSALS